MSIGGSRQHQTACQNGDEEHASPLRSMSYCRPQTRCPPARLFECAACRLSSWTRGTWLAVVRLPTTKGRAMPSRAPNLTRFDRMGYVAAGIALLAWGVGRRGSCSASRCFGSEGRAPSLRKRVPWIPASPHLRGPRAHMLLRIPVRVCSPVAHCSPTGAVSSPDLRSAARALPGDPLDAAPIADILRAERCELRSVKLIFTGSVCRRCCEAVAARLRIFRGRACGTALGWPAVITSALGRHFGCLGLAAVAARRTRGGRILGRRARRVVTQSVYISGALPHLSEY